MSFMKADSARLKKFFHIVSLIVNDIRAPDLYDREKISKSIDDVCAIKMFKNGSNIRIYCKEFSTTDGTFIVILSELLKKKKSQKNNKSINSIIEKVHTREYEIKERPQ